MSEDYGNDTHKERAAAWFAELRDNLCTALEAAENEVQGPNFSSKGEPGAFKKKTWKRPASDGANDAGGGGVTAAATPAIACIRHARGSAGRTTDLADSFGAGS